MQIKRKAWLGLAAATAGVLTAAAVVWERGDEARGRATADLLRVLREDHTRGAVPGNRAVLVADALRRGADPNSHYGTSPSPVAATLRLFQRRVLGRHDADTTVEARDRWSPLMMAALQGEPEVMDELIAAGAEKKLRSDSGKGDTTLGLAMISRSAPTVQWVLDMGANPNEFGNNLPPLIESVGQPDVTRLLLARGANPHLPFCGETMVSWVRQIETSRRRNPQDQLRLRQWIAMMEAGSPPT